LDVAGCEPDLELAVGASEVGVISAFEGRDIVTHGEELEVREPLRRAHMGHGGRTVQGLAAVVTRHVSRHKHRSRLLLL
jgi:hypothetical protein